MDAEPQEEDVVIRALGDQPGAELDRADLGGEEEREQGARRASDER